MIWSDQAIISLKEYAAAGINGADIAEKFGVSYDAIKSECRRLGIDVKGSGRRGFIRNTPEETIERIRATKLGKLGLSLEHAPVYALARRKGFAREEAAAIARRSVR